MKISIIEQDTVTARVEEHRNIDIHVRFVKFVMIGPYVVHSEEMPFSIKRNRFLAKSIKMIVRLNCILTAAEDPVP